MKKSKLKRALRNLQDLLRQKYTYQGKYLIQSECTRSPLKINYSPELTRFTNDPHIITFNSRFQSTEALGPEVKMNSCNV